MIERFRKASTAEKSSWIVYLGLIGFIVVALAFQWRTPSERFGLTGRTVEEWLAWAGLIGLAFAIQQLFVTEGLRALPKARCGTR
jgi:hypothetical protein